MAKSKSARINTKREKKVQRLRNRRITQYTPGLNFSDWITYSCSDAVKHTTMAVGSMVLLAGTAYALPQGGTVTSGGASISQSNAVSMVINQTTDKAIINWQGYSIAQDEAVKYVQPGSSSIALNRVTGVDASYLYGQLSANGQVWIINPNGLVVGPNANVNTAGLLLSTMDMSDQDFLAGNYTFASTSSSLASIINKGNIITADGGYVVLAASAVTNEGTIIANLGKIYLASGDEFTLNFAGNNLINLVINKETKDSLGIDNKGSIDRKSVV